MKIYKTLMLSVVVCACGAWSVTLGNEHRLRVFENRALRKIFGPEREELTGDGRTQHNEEH
jgi:hypothetical protein